MEESQKQIEETEVTSSVVGEKLEVDSAEPSDIDTALDSDTNYISTTSPAQSSSNFRVENGRHAFDENAYALPNDDQEVNRLDIQHHVWRLSLKGKLHLASLPPDVQNVLDVGTGTGSWAIDFAHSHLSAVVQERT